MFARLLRRYLRLRVRWTLWRMGRATVAQRRAAFRVTRLADQLDGLRLRLATLRFTTRNLEDHGDVWD